MIREEFSKYEIVLFDVDDALLDFTISEKKALHKAFCEFDLPTGLSDYHASYNEISQVLWRDLRRFSRLTPFFICLHIDKWIDFS